MAMYNITCRYWAVGGGCFTDIVNISMAITALPSCSASVYSPSHLYHPTIHHSTELQRMESISNFQVWWGGGSSLCTSRFGRHVLGVGIVYSIWYSLLSAGGTSTFCRLWQHNNQSRHNLWGNPPSWIIGQIRHYPLSITYGGGGWLWGGQ
jgi:hypothetical protein